MRSTAVKCMRWWTRLFIGFHRGHGLKALQWWADTFEEREIERETERERKSGHRSDEVMSTPSPHHTVLIPDKVGEAIFVIKCSQTEGRL